VFVKYSRDWTTCTIAGVLVLAERASGSTEVRAARVNQITNECNLPHTCKQRHIRCKDLGKTLAIVTIVTVVATINSR
jgi:hypothetical protein